MHPIVLAYNQVDNDAKVLKLVKSDDLDGLMRLLALGQASIRDCDEAGRSLLHHACHHTSVEIRQFLVDVGCDVDRTAVAFDDDQYRDTPLHCSGFLSTRLEKNELERFLLCRKHLLQAGADPTIGYVDVVKNGSSKTVIENALVESSGLYYVTKPFEQLVHAGSAFFDVRSFEISGESLWLYACSNVSILPSPGILRLLVEAGVTVAEVDDRGRNCFFKCVLGSSDSSSSKDFEALQYLLTVFDDIFAREKTGFNIFDMVKPDTSLDSKGSYRQDLWYCALYRAGLSRRFEIPPPISQPVFNSLYTIEQYRALLYRDTWDFLCWSRDDLILQRKRESHCGLSQWDCLDLLMMEDRIDNDADDDDEDHYDGDVSDDYNDESELYVMPPMRPNT